MTNWKEYKLGELLGKKGYIRGPFGSALKRPEMKSEGFAVYEQQHAIYNTREFRYFIDENKFIELNRFSILPNDLIISCSGTVGEVSIINEEDPKGIISQALLTLRPNLELVKPKFLYYFFKTKNGHNQLISASHGSVQINIAKREVVESIPISVPNIETQDSIIEILSSLDDKIELNNKINQELENLAQTLFKQWFIDFEFPNENGEPYKSSGGEMVDSELGEIPKGWVVKTLKDEFKLNMGQSPKGDTYNAIGEGMIFFQGRSDFGFRFPSVRIYTSDPKKVANKFETLISVRAPVGDINMAETECCIGRGLGSISHPKSFFSYTYYKMLSIQEELKSYDNEGTVFGSINKETLGNIKNIVPPISIAHQFNSLIEDKDSLVYNVSCENQELTKLRDSLLPKLISGELEVSEALTQTTA
jgi:type I restriction enzyme S subunit